MEGGGVSIQFCFSVLFCLLLFCFVFRNYNCMLCVMERFKSCHGPDRTGPDRTQQFRPTVSGRPYLSPRRRHGAVQAVRVQRLQTFARVVNLPTHE